MLYQVGNVVICFLVNLSNKLFITYSCLNQLGYFFLLWTPHANVLSRAEPLRLLSTLYTRVTFECWILAPVKWSLFSTKAQLSKDIDSSSDTKISSYTVHIAKESNREIFVKHFFASNFHKLYCDIRLLIRFVCHPPNIHKSFYFC